MAEIRCDSATLHVYDEVTGRCAVDDVRIGDMKSFDGRQFVAWVLPGDDGGDGMSVYAWLWKGDVPVINANPLWVNPGDIYNASSTVTVNLSDPSPDPVLLRIREYYSDE